MNNTQATQRLNARIESGDKDGHYKVFLVDQFGPCKCLGSFDSQEKAEKAKSNYWHTGDIRRNPDGTIWYY